MSARASLAATVALTLGLVGCYAAPPFPASGGELGGCHPGAYATLSEHPCRSDHECLLCATPTGCGRLRSRTELMRTNDACARPDPETCAGAEAHCCSGRCVVSLGAPPL